MFDVQIDTYFNIIFPFQKIQFHNEGILFLVLSPCYPLAQTASLVHLFKEDFSDLIKYFEMNENKTSKVSDYNFRNEYTDNILSVLENSTVISPYKLTWNATTMEIAKNELSKLVLEILIPTISAIVCSLCIICYVYTIKSFHIFCINLRNSLSGSNESLDEETGINSMDASKQVI